MDVYVVSSTGRNKHVNRNFHTWNKFTLTVIATDQIGQYKSNTHMIAASLRYQLKDFITFWIGQK
jgi:hypothetical protein